MAKGARDVRKMKSTEATSSSGRSNDVWGIDRRGALIGLGLSCGAALSFLRMPTASATPIPKASFQQMIPKTVGGWASRKSAEVVMPATDEGQDELYENLETRIYEGIGLPTIMVLIAYSSVQQNNVQVHRPEVCYPASGFPILWTKPAVLNLGPRQVRARELVAERGGLKERIIYWVRVGSRYPIGWAEQRLTMAASNARGVTPDGLLFRVSTIEESPNFTPSALSDFVNAFVRASTPTFQESVLF